MSGTSSGHDSEPVPEVPTEVPSDLEEDVASGEGVPGPPGPTVTPPSPTMTSTPVDAAASPSPVAELEALAKKQRLSPCMGDWLESRGGAVLLAARGAAGS